MKKINIVKVKYNDIDMNYNDGAKLRGFFGTKFIDVDYFHNHSKEGIIYRYPLIQYKVIDKKPTIVLLKKACDIAYRYNAVDKIIIGEDELISEDILVEIKKACFGVSKEIKKYKFVTPWIGLNQNNIGKYRKLAGSDEKLEFLENIVKGNILSLSKGMEYRVNERIDVKINRESIEEKKVYFKKKKLMAYQFEFHTNFVIPDDIGIGKACSRGFGSIKQINICE